MNPGGQRRPAGRGGVPVAHVARQGWATRGTLAMCVVVVALVTCLASVAPGLMERAATTELRTSLGAGTPDGTLVISLWDDDAGRRELQLDTATQVATRGQLVTGNLPATVTGLLTTPVDSLVGPELGAGTAEGFPVRLRFAYLVDAAGDPDGPGAPDVTAPEAGAVTWVAGGPPSTPVTPTRSGREPAPVLPVEVGVSDAVARTLALHAGDTFTAQDPDGPTLDVTVTGVFRPVDPDAPVWDVVPTAVNPHRVPGAAGRVEVAVLTGATSLPAARYDLPGARWTWDVTYGVVSDAVDAGNARDAARAFAALAAAPSELLPGSRSPTVTTRLDRLLRDALSRVDAAAAQATLVLSGVIATALLVLLLATSLLARRRARVLSHQRALGASLAALAAAAAGESLVLVAAGAAVGVAVGQVIVPGPVPWSWVAPPLVLACAAIPTVVVRTAARSSSPPPALRLDARVGRGAALRRPLVEAAVVLLAAGALATLRARGATSAAGRLGSDLVVLAAPVLVSAAVAVLLLRMLPMAARAWRRLASRSRGPVPLVAAARAPVGAVPVLALVLVTALLTLVLSVRATVEAGQVAGSWRAVGADASLADHSEPGLPEDLTARLAQAPGVTAVGSAEVSDGTQVLGEGTDVTARLVALDASAIAEVLAATPLPDAPGLAGLAGGSPAPGGPVRALANGLPVGATGLALHWEREAVPIEIVGTAPDLPVEPTSAARATVVVDRAALAAAVGRPVPATVVWVTGPGAAAAAADLGGGATVTTREGWLAHLRSSPITAAFDAMLAAATVLLTVLGVLVVVLAAAGGTPERVRVLVGLRVLGMPRRSGGRLVLAELVGPVLAPALAGIATGVVLSLAVIGPLGLGGLTGQTSGPSLVLPWWVGLSVLALGASVAAVAAAERPRAGRERLGQVLRSG